MKHSITLALTILALALPMCASAGTPYEFTFFAIANPDIAALNSSVAKLQKFILSMNAKGWTTTVTMTADRELVRIKKAPGMTIETILEKTNGCYDLPESECRSRLQFLNGGKDVYDPNSRGEITVLARQELYRVRVQAGEAYNEEVSGMVTNGFMSKALLEPLKALGGNMYERPATFCGNVLDSSTCSQYRLSIEGETLY